MNLSRYYKNIYVMAPLLCLITYITRVKPNDPNYFAQLGLAFLHGHLDIAKPENVVDLVFFHHKYYLYWPPVPAFVLMPFALIFGSHMPDGYISCAIGALNAWMFMKICCRLSERFSLGLTNRELFWAGMFWGLGTVHFYMARSGSVWFISQVMAQGFLLAAVYFFLENRRWWLSGICFALAVYTRNDLVFAALFFLFLYLAMNPGSKLKSLLQPVGVFIIPFIICSLLNAWYNYARFGSITDNGLSYHLMDEYFRPNFNSYGYFSTHYIPHNFYTEVIHLPTVILENPFIKDEPEGFGFLWASPFFLWIIPALGIWVYRLFKKPVSRSFTLMTIGSLAATIPIALTIFMIMGTGWRQFAARYTLDFQFFLLVFLVFLWGSLVKFPYARKISVALIVTSWLIQLVGAS